jgi:N-acyl homoserine lactone hydrolase
MFDPLSKCVALLAAACLFAAPLAGAAEPAPVPVDGVRLYTLDCGHLAFKDFGLFSDTGEYDGKPHELAEPCFVIRHPKGVLVWDTGLGDGIAANKDGVEPMAGIRLTVTHTLIDQLKAIGLAPADVTWLALSHVHFDHTGNANLFPASTWILNKADLAYAQAEPTPFGVSVAALSGSRTAKTEMIDGDYDVFGDGSVVILKAPGHTPGHQVLEVKLRKSGTVILSGDLYHSRANREFARVPKVNVSRADTLASINRIEKIVRNTHARFVIQHDPEDFKALPKSPAYLD